MGELSEPQLSVTSHIMDDSTDEKEDANAFAQPLDKALRHFERAGSLAGLVLYTHPISGRGYTAFGADCEDGMRTNERHLQLVSGSTR